MLDTKTFAAALAALLSAIVPALADDPIRPDPQLTPGAVLTTDTAAICRPGYAKSVRHVTPQARRRVYAERHLAAPAQRLRDRPSHQPGAWRLEQHPQFMA